MNLAHPLALLLSLLLIPIVLLYCLRVRVPCEFVGTAQFWRRALAEEKTRWLWRRWRPRVSLPLEILIVALLALAAAGPQIPASKHTVLILDNSATMRATDVQPSRMEAAKETARRMIASLRSCDEIAIAAVSPSAMELQSMTSDQSLLNAAVNSIQATGEPPALDWTVKLARSIRPEKTPPRIALITDAVLADATKQAEREGVEILRVGTAASNRAITCLNARRSKADPTKCSVFVELQNQGDQAAQGDLTLVINEKNGPSAPFTMVKNGRWQHTFELSIPVAARLKARIEPGDSYAFDDAASLDLPAAPAVHRVTLIASSASGLKEILAASPRVELIPAGADEKTIHIFSAAPKELPPGPALIFTPAACDLWQLGDMLADPLVTHVDDDSPITAGLRFVDAYLPEARQLQIADRIRAFARPILWANESPLGYAIDRPGGRIVVICGDLATSNLSLQADFPTMIHQALDWLDGQAPWKDEIIGLDQQASAMYSWSTSTGPRRALSENRPLATAAADIRVPSDIGSEAAALVVEKPRPPLWIVPAALAAILLTIEWCLYQRRWTG